MKLCLAIIPFTFLKICFLKIFTGPLLFIHIFIFRSFYSFKIFFISKIFIIAVNFLVDSIINIIYYITIYLSKEKLLLLFFKSIK